jgi:hypothetical protein
MKFCRLTLCNVWRLRSFVRCTYHQFFFFFASSLSRNLVIFYRLWVFQCYFTARIMLSRLLRIYRNPLKHGHLNKIKNSAVPSSRKTRCLHCKHQLINAVYGNNRYSFRELYWTHKRANCGVLNVKADCTCGNRLDLKCQSRGDSDVLFSTPLAKKR